MSHKRTDIRDAVITLLSNHTSAGARVSANLAFNTEDALPLIRVVTGTETATKRGNSGTQSIRLMNLQIILLAEEGATNSVQTVIDGLSVEVEDIMKANPLISSNAAGCIYKGSEFELDYGDRTMGQLTLNYEVTYVY